MRTSGGGEASAAAAKTKSLADRLKDEGKSEKDLGKILGEMTLKPPVASDDDLESPFSSIDTALMPKTRTKRGPLLERLIADGVITHNMAKKLRKELEKFKPVD